MEKVVSLFGKITGVFEKTQASLGIKYEIASVIDSYQDTKEVYVTVQVKGTAKTFNKSVKELYQKQWLDEFSREDVAYIGFLYAAEDSANLPLVEYFPRKKHAVTKSVVVLGMLFVSFLILSNLTAFKIVEFKFFHFLGISLSEPWLVNFPAALVFFPLTYFFDDTLTEVYGFKISRLIIWGGLICSSIFTLCAWATVYLPASPTWDVNTHHGASAYELIFKGSSRIFLASILGYFFGEFLNSMILAKLKVLTSGKHFFLRVIGSTAIGVGIDSIIFCNVAFFGIMPSYIIWSIVLTQYLFKLSYEIIMLPATYTITNFLKKVDQVDHYDFHTKFNPFSLSLSD
ncbi:MAG: queuosine precursor transporter [Gammaproteobacteria bacterium]